MPYLFIFLLILNFSYTQTKKEYFTKNILKSETHYKDGKRDGLRKKFYRNGKIQALSFWKNGKVEGKVTRFYPNRKLESIHLYKKGLRHGLTKIYYKNGQLKNIYNYKNDKLHGIDEEYGPKGTLISRYSWKNDKIDGICKKYYPNKQLKELCFYKNGKREGVEKHYNNKGVLITMHHWKNYHFHGPSAEYYNNGMLKETTTFKKDLEEGIRKEYDKQGLLIGESTWKSGLLNGPTKNYSHGKLQSISYWVNGKQDGVTKEFFNKDQSASLDWSHKKRKKLEKNHSNPYDGIINYELKNGIKVYLWPNDRANDFSIQVRVQVGTHEEDESTMGATHLLEHILFRSDKLSKDETYLNLFQKEGAIVNGETKYLTTDYFANITVDKGPWLIPHFAQMLGDRNITGLDINTERQTVEVEIGSVSFLKKYLGFDYDKFFNWDYFPYPPTQKSEFNLTVQPFSEDQIRVSTKKLTIQTLQNYYDTYYHPENMSLFITGKFSPEKIKVLIKDNFSKIKRRLGKKQKMPKATLSKKTFFESWLGSDNDSPEIIMGVKYNEISLKEKILLTAYFNDLSMRLMQDIRNRQGKTYTVTSEHYPYANAGFLGIKLDTTVDKMEETYTYIKKLFQEEIIDGNITKKDYHRIMDAHWSNYLAATQDFSESLLEKLVIHHEHKMFYRNHYNAYTEFFTSFDNFKKILKKSFAKEKLTTEFSRKFTYFESEDLVFTLLSCFLTILLLHMFYKHSYSKVGISVDIKLHTPTVYRFNVFILAIFAWIISILISWPIESQLLPFLGLLHSISQYDFYAWLYLVKTPFIVWFVYLFAGMPKKELIANDKEIILLGLKDRSISYSDIKSITTQTYNLQDVLLHFPYHFGWSFKTKKVAVKILTEKENFIVWTLDTDDLYRQIKKYIK